MKLIFLFGLFICIIQMCSALKTFGDLKTADCDPAEVSTAEEIEQNRKTFGTIKGISDQASHDFNNITKRNCVIHNPLLVSIKILTDDLKADTSTVNLNDAVEHFKNHGADATELSELIQEMQKIPETRLHPDQVARFVTFFKGFGKDGTLDEVKSTLNYLYGPNIKSEQENK